MISEWVATRNESLDYTRFVWTGGTFFPVVLLFQFLSWWEIGFGFTYYLCT